ncbi:MAG TPA: XRE family transcriptional regulator [Nitrospirae bacterium]|nr:XRE family transcriptional regulator [Nitrospirota bacterium]HDZ02890.1 XRE family transcriptional regulator [Nitrospirota bacterium]
MPESVEKQIGIQIARIRKEHEITQEQLAELVDVAPETISRIERGTSIPSLKTLEKISAALHISLKDLFDFKYRQKPLPAIEKESMKLLTFLKAKKADDIKMSHRILKSIFEQIEKNYQPKR